MICLCQVLDEYVKQNACLMALGHSLLGWVENCSTPPYICGCVYIQTFSLPEKFNTQMMVTLINYKHIFQSTIKS